MSKHDVSIQPAFGFDEPNESVVLAHDTASFVVDDKSYTGEAEVRLDLLPRARIHVHVHVLSEDPSLSHVSPESVKSLSLSRLAIELDGSAINTTWSKSEGVSVVWLPGSEPIISVGGDATELSYVLFHVFNFRDILGTRRTTVTKGTSSRGIEHVDMEAMGWSVELRSLVKTRDSLKKLRAKGGYGLTYIGCFRRTDGGHFTGKDAMEALSALRSFLSFAKGASCDPVCPVGFHDSKGRVWEAWSSPGEPWHSPMSWFDPLSSSQLVALFPGFMKRWANDDWREALHEVIYWYLNANNDARGIDAGIILTQAAIERLSYEYAVKERKLIEARGFKDLRASDKFRLLLSSLGIPLEIPASLSEMSELGGQFNWLDAPHALTEVRNSLVHPEHKQRGSFSNAYFEAWNLGLWHLELSLLNICGYNGTYSNRLVHKYVGTVEDVPWKP